jgi:hypothetical protein
VERETPNAAAQAPCRRGQKAGLAGAHRRRHDIRQRPLISIAIAVIDIREQRVDASVPAERQQSDPRRRIRRRARASSAEAWLHAVGEGSHPPRWEQRRAEANERTTEQEQRVKAIQQKLDRVDEAFLYSESIDLTSYSRQRDKLREELTLAQIDRHTEAVDELDLQGILAFAERILPRASDLWIRASLDYKQRLQQLFFPEGIGTTFQLLGAV